jgi:hypothetical protein
MICSAVPVFRRHRAQLDCQAGFGEPAALDHSARHPRIGAGRTVYVYGVKPIFARTASGRRYQHATAFGWHPSDFRHLVKDEGCRMNDE